MAGNRSRQERTAGAIGIILTVLIHAGALGLGLFSGIRYIYPPPEEEELVIEFEELDHSPVVTKTGQQPVAVDPDPSRDIELVKTSEAQEIGTQQNEAPEATVGDDGDVDVPEPPREKEINRRALFHAANNTTDKDTLAPQTAPETTDRLSPGHASGNTDTGRDVGTPNAKLQGRRPVNGYLPKPVYRGQNSGTVVVTIKVDNYGKVTSAVVSAEGTTVTDKTLWQAALNAAKETKFNTTMDAPPSQEGTITYIFRITK